MSQDAIRQAYGELSTQSAPADPDNPSFTSLLSAYQGVHQGTLEPDILSIYHRHLTAELDNSERVAREGTEGHPLRMILTTLDLARIALAAIPDYLARPSADAMAECVQRLLVAHNAFQQLHYYLDTQGASTQS